VRTAEVGESDPAGRIIELKSRAFEFVPQRFHDVAIRHTPELYGWTTK
jgi:hypothetical protein